MLKECYVDNFGRQNRDPFFLIVYQTPQKDQKAHCINVFFPEAREIMEGQHIIGTKAVHDF